MTASAARLDMAAVAGSVLPAIGTTLARNPVAVGGTTAFLVILFYVSANAIWNQPFPHPEPLLQTRVRLERTPVPVEAPRRSEAPAVEQPTMASLPETAPETTRSIPQPDNRILRAQQALKDLQLYTGDVDGLNGPRTRKAVAAFQQSAGLAPTGTVDDALLASLFRPAAAPAPARPETPAQPVPTPVAAPRTRPAAAAPQVAKPVPVASDTVGQADVVKIQAGLRAFGHEGIEIDGVLGERTKAAIREFQNLFGLPVTGTPDTALLAKMGEIGLTD